MSRPAVTVVIPWDRRHPELFELAYASIPNGIPYLIAFNNGKLEMASALNEAIQQVATPFVFVMGADDLLEPDTIDRLVMACGSAAGAYPTLRRFGNDEGDFPPDLWSPWRLQDWNFVPGAALYRTSVLQRLGYRDTIFEDWDLAWRIAKADLSMVPCPDAIYHYRIHGDSLSDRIVTEAAQAGIGVEHIVADIIGDTRVQPVATFYAQGNLVQAYQRCQLPANRLPAIARRTFDAQNSHHTPASIWQFPGMKDAPLIQHARAKCGHAILIDVDDDYLTPAFARTTRAWGQHDLTAAWARERPWHRRLVREADAIIVSTLPLADTYSRYNDRVHVIPNAVEPADWPKPSRLEDGRVRIGWAAGTQHHPDAVLVEPALRWAASEGGCQVITFGIDPGWNFEYWHVPFTSSPQMYRDALSAIDIGVAPVLRGAINNRKSDIKFLDYTMAGALTIASSVPAYTHTIRDGETGLLATGKKQFLRHVQDAVNDPEATFRIVRAAQQYVLGKRTAHHLREPYLTALASVGAVYPDLEPEAVPA